ncbi:hypothetical protein KXJ91_001400 [Campylobacter coli]|nr:hypothetical protein [Campylobacter coli]
MKKITKRTLKSFINKNKNILEIKVSQKFNGLDDSLNSTGENFKKPIFLSKIGYFKKSLKYHKQSNSYFSILSKDEKLKDLNNRYKNFCLESLGINGIKILKDSLIEYFEDDNYKGYSVFNCVNKVFFAVKKTA